MQLNWNVQGWPFSRHLNRTDLICSFALARSAGGGKAQPLPDAGTAVRWAPVQRRAWRRLACPSLPCHTAARKRLAKNSVEKRALAIRWLNGLFVGAGEPEAAVEYLGLLATGAAGPAGPSSHLSSCVQL